MSTATYKAAVEAIYAKHNPNIDALAQQSQEMIDQHSNGGFIPNWPDTETSEKYASIDASWKAAIEARNAEIESIAGMLADSQLEELLK